MPPAGAAPRAAAGRMATGARPRTGRTGGGILPGAVREPPTGVLRNPIMVPMTPEMLTETALPPVPLTVEGASVLHQMLRFRWSAWRATGEPARAEILSEAIACLEAMEQPADG